MNLAFAWLFQLITAHLVTDFILQPSSWVAERQQKHFASGKLYLHGLLTGIVALLMAGFSYWLPILIISITHIIIDGWKSYRPEKPVYFLVDQGMHLLAIFITWYFLFFQWRDVSVLALSLHSNHRFWTITAAFLFLSFPAGIAIGKLTKRWQDQIKESSAEISALADAGKWIGILERTIILVLILQAQYGAIGLLIAAKSILRFNQTNNQEAKSEYVLIGSLISIGLAIATGVIIVFLLGHKI